jgi:hypothetical protein
MAGTVRRGHREGREMSYTLQEGVDWEALDGARVLVGVSVNWVTLKLRDGTLIKIARAKGVRQRKARPELNGAGEEAR